MVLYMVALFSVVLIVVLLGLNLFIGLQADKKDVLTPFECGFHSIGVLQKSYSMQFFLVMLLFVIFDVEVVLFLGLLVKTNMGLGVFILLMFILLGLWLEWYMGKLVWTN